jgi:hypothetical protein
MDARAAHEGGQPVGWRDAGPPSRWLRRLAVGFVVVGSASAATLLWLSLRAAGADGAPDGLRTPQTAAQVLWGLQVAVMVAILVLEVAWTRRLAANHVALSRPGTRFGTPGWAVGAWLLWFVLPVLVVRELWKGSDPQVPEGSPAWRGVRTSPLVALWFVTFVLGTLALNLTNDALDRQTRLDPDRLVALALWRGVATAVLVGSAVLLHGLVGRLTRRQETLIATM